MPKKQGGTHITGHIILEKRRICYIDPVATKILKTSSELLLDADFISLWKANDTIRDLVQRLNAEDSFALTIQCHSYNSEFPVELIIERQKNSAPVSVKIISPEKFKDSTIENNCTIAKNNNLQSVENGPLKTIFNNLTFGVCILSETFEIIQSNSNFWDILEIPPENRDKKVSDIKFISDIMENWVNSKEIVSTFDYNIHTRSGINKQIQCFVIPFSFLDSTTELISIYINIKSTELQGEVVQSIVEKRYLSIIDNIAEGISIIELIKNNENSIVEYCFKMVNTAFEQFLGITKNTLEGEYYPSKNGILDPFWIRLFHEQQSTTPVLKGRYFDHKTQFFFEYLIAPMGKNSVYLNLTNITYKIKAEKIARKSERKFRSLAENNPDLIIQYSPELHVVYMNKHAYSLAHKIKVQKKITTTLSAKHISELVHNKIQEVAKTKQTAEIIETQNISGSRIHLLWSIIPEISEEGIPLSYLTIARDISLLKRRESELKIAKDKAVELDQLKTAFLANMSHEIRTPLNGMIGFAQLLKVTSNTDPDFSYYLRTIEDNGYKLLTIINDILDLSKIEAGRISMLKSPFDANSMIHDLFKLFQIKLEGSKSSVEFKLQLPDPLTEIILFSDEGRIRQVISNLIDNAIKFTRNGKIILGYFVTEFGDIRFFVSDTGLGIKKDDQKMIFDRFRQAQPNHLNPYGGNGLGLSISKKYVEMLNGKIHLDSEVGKGTTFYVTFPTTTLQDCEEERKNQISTEIQVDWRRQTVLIVEDDPDAFFIISRHLDDTNIKIIHAENGKRAMELFQKENIDLVLMDIRLPDMDGYDVTEWIRNQGSDLPIIFQSANVLNNDHKKSLEIGGNEFLAKPYSAEQLIVKMNKYLG